MEPLFHFLGKKQLIRPCTPGSPEIQADLTFWTNITSSLYFARREFQAVLASCFNIKFNSSVNIRINHNESKKHALHEFELSIISFVIHLRYLHVEI